ncbi:MAG: rRNA maturation RNase YbeY [Proteobacteria bacterium]|nr:rRNA maturation RNase YbeY [Pseudomonadota bacterium]
MNVTIEITNACDPHWIPELDICERWIYAALDLIGADKAYSVSLRFVDEIESKSLNKKYRAKSNATNVLSFPANFPATISKQFAAEPLGDVVICPAILEREAAEQGKTLEAHNAHLLIHGVLHLLGYDHDSEANAETMEQREINILENLGFPNPYLIG